MCWFWILKFSILHLRFVSGTIRMHLWWETAVHVSTSEFENKFRIRIPNSVHAKIRVVCVFCSEFTSGRWCRSSAFVYGNTTAHVSAFDFVNYFRIQIQNSSNGKFPIFFFFFVLRLVTGIILPHLISKHSCPRLMFQTFAQLWVSDSVSVNNRRYILT